MPKKDVIVIERINASEFRGASYAVYVQKPVAQKTLRGDVEGESDVVEVDCADGRRIMLAAAEHLWPEKAFGWGRS